VITLDIHTETAAIYGRATSDGNPVGGATIHYVDLAGSASTTTTDADGYYTIYDALPNQPFEISAAKTNYIGDAYDITAQVFHAVRQDFVLGESTGFGHPTQAVCPDSIDAISKPASGGTPAVFKTYTWEGFFDDASNFVAYCDYRLPNPASDDIHETYGLTLYYYDDISNSSGCGATSNVTFGSTSYNWIRKLRAQTLFSSSSFSDYDNMIGELLDKAASDGIGAPCP
ncbi:MAG TPA: carboxypeptidase-like regulatory domain-containing protein, partial [Gammaproteobacteria bacterium]